MSITETTNQKAVNKERRKLRRAVVRAAMSWWLDEEASGRDTPKLQELGKACKALEEHIVKHKGSTDED